MKLQRLFAPQDATFYGSYDSEPPPAANAQSDFGVTTSLGYSF